MPPNVRYGWAEQSVVMLIQASAMVLQVVMVSLLAVLILLGILLGESGISVLQILETLYLMGVL